jgi:hypothetical protein
MEIIKEKCGEAFGEENRGEERAALIGRNIDTSCFLPCCETN